MTTENTAQNTVSEADMNLLAMIKASNSKKSTGLGYMWGSATESVGELAGAVSEAAKATRILAQVGTKQAVLANVEADKEILEAYGIEAYGIEATGLEAVMASEQLMRLLTQRR